MTKRKSARAKEESLAQTKDAMELLSSLGEKATEATMPETEEALPETEQEAAAKEAAVDMPMTQQAQAQVTAETVDQPQQPLTEQPSVQNGKESLPPPQEEEKEDYDEDEQEKDYREDQQEPVFSEQDRQDLPVLENKVKHHGLEMARALREIRTRKLWMTLRNEDGTRQYKRFDEYCAQRLGHEKQWVTQQTNWLERVETLAVLRAQGHDVPEIINATVANSLPSLDECAGPGEGGDDQGAAGLLAVIKEAVAEGVKLTATNSAALRKICHRRRGYYGATTSRPAAPSYDQYKTDLERLTAIATMPTDYNTPGKVMREKEDNRCSYAEAAEKVYIRDGSRPNDSAILHNATGDDLKDVIGRLQAAQAKRVALEQAKANLSEANRRAKEASQAVQQAQAAAGVGKPKPAQKQPDDNKVEVDRQFQLVIVTPAMNPATFALPSAQGCVDKIGELLDAAIKQTATPGDEYTLSLSVIVKAVAVEVQNDEEGEEEEQEELKPIIDPEQTVLEEAADGAE